MIPIICDRVHDLKKIWKVLTKALNLTACLVKCSNKQRCGITTYFFSFKNQHSQFI